MKSLLLFPALLLFLFGQPAVQRSVQNITVTFVTRQDAKPWNALVEAKVNCAGQTIATLQCCSGDEKRDEWAVRSAHFRDMQLAQPLPKVALSGCTLDLGMQAPAGSRWTVSPTLTVVYSDGSKKRRTFDDTTFVSSGGAAAKSFGLDL